VSRWLSVKIVCLLQQHRPSADVSAIERRSTHLETACVRQSACPYQRPVAVVSDVRHRTSWSCRAPATHRHCRRLGGPDTVTLRELAPFLDCDDMYVHSVNGFARCTITLTRSALFSPSATENFRFRYTYELDRRLLIEQYAATCDFSTNSLHRRCCCKPAVHCNKLRDPVDSLEKFCLCRKLCPALQRLAN